MSKHTPEPWRADEDQNVTAGEICFPADAPTISADDADGWNQGKPILIAAVAGGIPGDEATANRLRIVACVNSLAGVSDPEKAVQAAREALIAAGELSDLGSSSAAAFDHGDEGGHRRANSEIRKLHAQIDAALALLTVPAGAATEAH